jgi:phosphohistidine phosphatase SixA
MSPTFTRFLQSIVLTGVAALCAQLVAQAAEPKSLAASLREGGYVIVMRHGATNRDMTDTDPLNVDDPDNVAKQRQLSERGRQTARDVGDAIKVLHIPVGEVYSSKFNRAAETARLVGGKDAIRISDISEGGQVVTTIENERRAAALRTLAGTPPPPGTNTLLVTHKPNIVDAFGKDWFDVREGEASVFRPDGHGKYELVARVPADRWLELAKNP